MQELYYISESATLTLLTDTGIRQQWTGINNLIVCSSLYEITAFSGSEQVVAFPINNTNLYYDVNAINIPPPIDSGSYAALTTYFSIQDIISTDLSSCSFYITSSTVSISGSTDPATLFFSPPAENTYTFKVTGSGKYDSYLYVGDLSIESLTPEVGYSLVYVSGSNQGVSASVYLSASHNYSVYMTIIGDYAP